MQVVLFGQPELNDKLSLPELRQLKQRVTFSYTLQLMDVDQVFQYVKHRMNVAGYRGGDLFDRKCCTLLFKASKGTPRIVNVLCHKALMLAYGEGLQKISRLHVKLAIKDTEAANQPSSALFISSVSVLVVMLAFCLAYFAWLGFTV